MNELEKKTGMTDEEADYWDEYYTKNPPEIDPATNGGFAKKSFSMIAVDRLSEVIGELVREKIAVSA